MISSPVVSSIDLKMATFLDNVKQCPTGPLINQTAGPGYFFADVPVFRINFLRILIYPYAYILSQLGELM
jgi:hypothetical protein